MENTIAKEVAKNEEVIKNPAVNGGIIALTVAGIAAAGYCIWKGVPKLKEIREAKKEADEAKAEEHQFFVPNP